MSKPGKENTVEKASDELSLSTLYAKKSLAEHLITFHILFGAIKGKII